MARSRTLAHNPGLTSEVHNWRAVGENVGEGPTIEDLDSAFMNSSEHRANILDPSYADFGVGYTTRNGIIWIAIDFRDPMTSYAAAAPATTAAPIAASYAAPVTTTYAPPSNLLQQGSVGAKVARIQRVLGVAHDGLFGPRTRHAVVRFQHEHDLVIDGIVGPKTRAVLRRFERKLRVQAHTQQLLHLLLVVWPTLPHALSSDGSSR